MFRSRFPRVFVWASLLLLSVVAYTTLYLYHHEARPHHSPVASPQSATSYHGHAATHSAHDALTTTIPDRGGASRPTHPTAQHPDPTRLPEHEPAANPEDDQTTNKNQRPPPTFHPGGGNALPDPKDCPEEMQFVVRAGSELGMTQSIKYSRRRIQAVFSDGVNRNEIVNVTDSLIRDVVEVDLLDCREARLPVLPPIKLQVPRPYAEQSFEHLIFGIATDYERLNASIPTFSHWISGTGAKLVAVVTDSNERKEEQMRQLRLALLDAGIDATLVRPLEESYTTSQNHFTVLVSMLEFSKPGTQWYALVDDDTFYPSLKPLSDTLAALDHTTDAYAGALSEDFNSVRNYGFMAFGGAGAYLTAPLAAKLADKASKCIQEASSPEGDIIIRDCVYFNSKAKLTILPDLYQQDMRDDVSGFFEGGFRPLTLHHWKSWYKEPVAKMAAAAQFCGDCFLQRWRFGNDTVLSNGFSVAEYRDGLDAVDLHTVEGTWMEANLNYDFSIGPVRQSLSPEKKKSWKLKEVEKTKEGHLKQLYVRWGNADAGELDEVVELVWES